MFHIRNYTQFLYTTILLYSKFLIIFYYLQILHPFYCMEYTLLYLII
nr:MAG TPA_asm: hypothetical protein [Caudoviricetes sp.]